jgi:hypothetical protein
MFELELLELNGTHQLMVYAADSNLLLRNINIIKDRHKLSVRC